MLLVVLVQGLCFGSFHWVGLIGLSFGFWVMFSALLEPMRRLRQGQALTAGAARAWRSRISGSGMFAIGASGVESYKIEKDVALKPGGSFAIAGYDFRFVSAATCAGRITMRWRRWWRSPATAGR